MNSPDSWLRELGLDKTSAPQLFRTISDLDTVAEPLATAHALRRAWEAMALDGVYCSGGTPLAYFKEFPRHDAAALTKLHRAAWNSGLAPLVVAITPREVRVYSTLALPAARPEDLDTPGRLARLFDRVADALDLLQFVQAVELGEFFQAHQGAFDPEQRVDGYLLDNLDATRRELFRRGGLDLKAVHALLGRVVFTCYLVDRGVISGDYFAAAGAPGASSLLSLLSPRGGDDAQASLYALFRRLKADFNGDVFGADLDTEEACVTAAHMDVLRRFLRGDGLAGGQVSLGFWVYDFRVIPIETISAVYEQALEAEGELEAGEDGAEYRRKKGAFYTPRNLAQLAVGVAMGKASKDMLGLRVLDPACGSGIFLVTVFSLMAEAWEHANPAASRHERFVGLSQLLTERIFGVDESAAACGVAALSMYLSLLDRMSPPDIQELQREGGLLPRLVHDPTDAALTGRTLIVGNFFSEDLPLGGAKYDIVVGNPPWASVRPDDPMVKWCRKRELPLAQNQLAYGFVWKACEHVAAGGRATFVLPASTLFNSQEKALIFLDRWLSHTTVETVVNLADLCFLLFRDASRPAIIARFRPEMPDSHAHRIEYLVPKAQAAMLYADVLAVAAADRVAVGLVEARPTKSVAYRRGRRVSVLVPPSAWKQRFWGTGRDRRLLDRLADYPPLFSAGADGRSERGWLLCEGFNRLGAGKAKQREALGKLRYLNHVNAYVLGRGALGPPYGFGETKRCPPEEVFYGPHVVFPHGVSRKGERLRAAFSNEDFTFNHSIRVIKGEREDEELLRFLTCVLCSPLALYVFFHTVGNWGTERAKIHVGEYASFPFPRPDSHVRGEIVGQAAALHRELEGTAAQGVFDSGAVEDFGRRFDDLVYQYYEIDDWERALVEDTVNVSIPSATPSRGRQRSTATRRIPTLRTSTPEERAEYRRMLCEALNGWARGSGWTFQCLGTVANTSGLGVASVGRLRTDSGSARPDTSTPETSAAGALDAVLERVRQRLGGQTRGADPSRNLKVFDGTELHIVKPLARRHWTRTAALNDADDIAAAVLTSGGE